MCNCILKLTDKGFVERESVYENHDFIDKGYMIRKYKKQSRQTLATNQVFHLNYCPACGEKIS